MFKKLFFTGVFISFLISGCQKDELTLPAQVDFIFEMKPFIIEWEDTDNVKVASLKSNVPDKTLFNKKEAPHSFLVNQAKLTITSIEIEGEREQGDDVFLVSDFDPPLEVQFSEGTGTPNQNVSFDLPQGIYKKLDIVFYLGTDDEPAISLNGSISPGESGKASFNFDYPLKEKLETRATHQTSAENIVLSKNNKSQAKVIFNAEYLFGNLSVHNLSGTRLSYAPNQQEVVVNQKNNSYIYEQLMSRLEKSIAVVFE